MTQEEIQKPATSITASVPVEETSVPVKEVDVPVTAEKTVEAPAPESTVAEPEVTAEKEEGDVTGKEILQSESFKEESYLASELPDVEKNALAEFKEMVREALNKREFSAPPPPPTPVKEEKTEEKKEEVNTEEKSVQAETKTEEKPDAPVTVETKEEEKLAAPAPISTETKKEETSVVSAPVAEPKKEEKSVVPAPVETKPAASVTTETKEEEKVIPVETKPADPVVAETKKEEIETKAADPVTTETKEEEKVVPVETKTADPVSTETKEEEKADTVVDETKKEEKATASVPVTRAVSRFIKDIFVSVTTKKEEDKPASDQEGTKTVEATEEPIVSITLPETAVPLEPEEVSIWGIPLLEDERSDVILLKFLRARDFKVKEAFTMLKNAVQWRKENKIDELVEEDLEGSEFEKLVFTHGVDKQGRTVIYSSYGEFQNKELFSDKEKLSKFLKWRMQFQEKCVRALDFSPEAKSSFVFVSDFRNAPGLGKRALWQFIRRAVKQFEDNYPEFVAKELFINVPWWYIPYYKTFGTIITSPRTRSKMILAGPSKSAETIFKYIAPEVVPVEYGGLSKESPFTVEDGVNETIAKSSSKSTIDFPVSEGSTVSWELRILGADVSYEAHFEPSNESSYTMIVSKNRKISLTDEQVITDSFKVTEPGKIVIIIDNQTFKKKKVLYRFKTQQA